MSGAPEAPPAQPSGSRRAWLRPQLGWVSTTYFAEGYPYAIVNNLADYQEWILGVIEEVCTTFEAEFRHLWQTERTGILYPASLFEDQGHASTPACDAVLTGLWRDAWTICGIEMHRRCLSLAHNADFEDIGKDNNNQS